MLGLNKNDKDYEKRSSILLENIDWKNIIAEDCHLFGIALGIGIYNPSQMNKSYTDLVLKLAASGSLYYLISDDSISYGTNYPFENIIVDSFMKEHSVKTIFQLFARAGRPGKSWKANIYVHDDVIEKLNEHVLSKIKETNYIDIEVYNFNKAIVSSILTPVLQKRINQFAEEKREKLLEIHKEKQRKEEIYKQKEQEKKEREIQKKIEEEQNLIEQEKNAREQERKRKEENKFNWSIKSENTNVNANPTKSKWDSIGKWAK